MTAQSTAPKAINLTTGGPVGLTKTMRRRRMLSRSLDYGLYAAILVLIIFFSIASPYFLSARNLTNIVIAVSATGVLAAGFTAALIGGQVDISIGAVVGLSGVSFAVLQENVGLPAFWAGVIAVLFGMAVGVINGILVLGVGINSLIATLAVSVLITGVALILAGGQPIPLTDTSLSDLITARPLGVPVPVIAVVAIFAVGWVVFSRTRLGWRIYAIGANPSAALRAGIATNRITMGLFITSGGLAAIGGLISTGQGGSGVATTGNDLSFQVLAAVLLAGFGISGGLGKFERAFIGVLLVGVLLNGLVLLGVDAYYQYLARGVVFVGAVILASVSLKKAAR